MTETEILIVAVFLGGVFAGALIFLGLLAAALAAALSGTRWWS